jgi:hypothetical protein
MRLLGRVETVPFLFDILDPFLNQAMAVCSVASVLAWG